MYYELDKKAAIAADTGSNRIGEKGKYIGRFTRAQHIVSGRTGTEGIDFDFETTDGKRARFTLYTRKSDGTTINYDLPETKRTGRATRSARQNI